MMFHIINALLLLPLDWISEMLPDILPLLSVIDCLCKMLPEIHSFEAFELEGKAVQYEYIRLVSAFWYDESFIVEHLFFFNTGYTGINIHEHQSVDLVRFTEFALHK